MMNKGRRTKTKILVMTPHKRHCLIKLTLYEHICHILMDPQKKGIKRPAWVLLTTPHQRMECLAWN